MESSCKEHPVSSCNLSPTDRAQIDAVFFAVITLRFEDGGAVGTTTNVGAGKEQGVFGIYETNHTGCCCSYRSLRCRFTIFGCLSFPRIKILMLIRIDLIETKRIV